MGFQPSGTLSGQKSSITYDSYHNATSYRLPGHASSENAYDTFYGGDAAAQKRHLPLRFRTPERVADYYGYDSYGNRVNSRRFTYDTYESGAAETSMPFIRTENEYHTSETDDPSIIGNYLHWTKDARGNVVTQEVNPRTGTLTSITDPTNQAVTYEYDAAKRVTKVETAVPVDATTSNHYRNEYTYEKDRIKTVRHKAAGC